MPVQPKSPRPTNPRRWTTLAAASVSLAVGAPGHAEVHLPQLAIYKPQQQDAQLWLAQAEGGEGGESGAVADTSLPETYLAQLSIVEGHLIAAAELYRNGMKEDAIALSHHPEAEMMDAVRAALAAHGAKDITPEMQAFSAAMEADEPTEAVDAALVNVREAIAAAQASEASAVKTRFAALTLLVKAASEEYAGSLAEGKVDDLMAYNEAHAFILSARDLATGLQAVAEKPAGRILEALKGADEAFGDLTSATPEARDPAILAAIAAKVELIGNSVH
jgi:hypothetical protein